jgi:4-alpha-glucanotransferase
VLLPVRSLGGIEHAERWLDFLSAAGQSYWQILPLTIPGEGGSPYKSVSAFALDPALAHGFAQSRDLELPELRDYFDFVGNDRESVEAQYAAYSRWLEVRAYAHSRGIEIIGDVPIYVAPDSSDHFAHPELFRTDAVAGVPPDAFSSDGQLWGNPLYDWTEHKRTGFAWWLSRLKWWLTLCDVVRIDHFRGLDAYWAVPTDAKSAKLGRWEPAPGKALIDAIRSALPGARIIAEDLGHVTKGVRKLVRYSRFPNMKVLQFAFDSATSDHLPDLCGLNSVVYTGTHDNDTVRGWANSANPTTLGRAMRFLEVRDPAALPDAFVQCALDCASKLCVIPIQDWLGLGSEARVNTPGTVGAGNWTWTLDLGLLTPALALAMRSATRRADRLS